MVTTQLASGHYIMKQTPENNVYVFVVVSIPLNMIKGQRVDKNKWSDTLDKAGFRKSVGGMEAYHWSK